ncbi:hypothetical protein GCM10023184_08020 [Flaviaesturariibacter amylovorans]|uniref:DUF3098 domain-containing protein n=1 Tax=Flaviaesturariibacter amylovorans TaxID=1084520 RepID=A0ABP8GCP6_9BACT
MLLIWSGITLGGFIYVLQDVHRVPLWMPLSLAGMAVIGLYFFFAGLARKKRN